MKAILSADRNWGIGNGNKLLVSIPSDMKFFRQTTTGKVVVMGRKTLESFPNGQPLKNRTNIVLTENPDYRVKDAVIVHSKEELLKTLEQYDTEDIYIIGGESIYRMMLPYCDTVRRCHDGKSREKKKENSSHHGLASGGLHYCIRLRLPGRK